MGNEPQAGEVIVIKKAWVATAAIALLFFVAGWLGGSFVSVTSYERGLVAGQGSAAVAQGAGAAPEQAQAPAPAQAQAPAAAPAQPPARLDNVSIDDDPSLGNPDAPVVVVEFSDFECPFCGRFRQDTFDQIMEQYGDDILFVYRDFPLSTIHPRAQQSAEAAECADDQGKFWEYHDLLFANQVALDFDSLVRYAEELELDTEAFSDCLNTEKYRDEVLADFTEGQSYGVSGTPTFFINGVQLVGAQPIISFQQILDQELGG